MKKLVGISTFVLQNKFGDREALRIARQIGADAVDFSTGEERFDYRNPDSIYSKSDEEIVAYFAELRALAEELGLVISQTHGRVEGFRNDTAEDEALLENARRDLLACRTLGAPVCVIHAPTTIFLGPDADPALMHDLNFAQFDRMLAWAKEYGVGIATETFGDASRFGCCDFFGNLDEFVAAYERVCAAGNNRDYMTVCVDTGHSNKATRFGNPSPADVIRRLGPSVSVLHLHDNDTLTDQHKIPLTGSIDWDDVLDALDEVGYTGVYNMEINNAVVGGKALGLEVETLEYAVRVMRRLLECHYKAE